VDGGEDEDKEEGGVEGQGREVGGVVDDEVAGGWAPRVTGEDARVGEKYTLRSTRAFFTKKKKYTCSTSST